MNIYNTLSHATDINSAVSALGVLGIQNPLPVNISSVQQLLAGRGGVSGLSGSLSGLFNNSYSYNNVYTSTGNSFEAIPLQRRASSRWPAGCIKA
jgi:hypothetical protein